MSARRRLVNLLVLSLALGVATTVAVAWILVVTHGDVGESVPVLYIENEIDDGPGYIGICTAKAGAERLNLEFFLNDSPYPDIDDSRRLPEWSQRWVNFVDRDAELSAYLTVNASLDARGWPRLALSGAIFYVRPDTRSRPRGALLLNGSATEVHLLPLTPIWPGIMIDTALYGLLWLVLMVAPGWTRRRFRRHLGRCVRCGYDLRGSEAGAGCPECGLGPDQAQVVVTHVQSSALSARDRRAARRAACAIARWRGEAGK